MTFRTDLLAVADDLRGLPAELDLRQYRVFVIRREWTGETIGDGTYTDTETEILISRRRYPPRVQELTSKDIVASGGRYTDYDLKVGPITPEYQGGGVNPMEFESTENAAQPTEFFFRVEGPGLPVGGGYYDRSDSDITGNFGHYFVLRANGRKP